MIDIKLLRTEIDTVANQLKRKGYELPVTLINELEAKRKDIQSRTENQKVSGTAALNTWKSKAQGRDIAPLIAEMDSIGAELEAPNWY